MDSPLAALTRAVVGTCVVLLVTCEAVSAQNHWAGGISIGRAMRDEGVHPFPSGQPSISLNLHRRAASALAVGLEAGYHLYSKGPIWLSTGPGTDARFEVSQSTWRLTPVLRLQPSGTVRPYLLLGAGVYGTRGIHDPHHVESKIQPGAVLGLGIDLFPRRWNLGLSAAARGHFPAGRDNYFGALELGMAWRFGSR